MTNDEFCQILNDEIGSAKFNINPYIGPGKKIPPHERFEITIDVPQVNQKAIHIRILTFYMGGCVADCRVILTDKLPILVEAIYFTIRKIQKDMHKKDE